MAILNSFMVWLMQKRMYQIDLFRKNPIETQNELFDKLIKTAQSTEWGIKYDYKSIENISDYTSRVPVSSYEVLKPYIERLRKGEQNILWSTNIRYFAKSSGTTDDKSKFIPVSDETLSECHYKAGKDMLAIYCTNYSKTKLFDGKSLALGGSQQINEYDTGAYYGDVSAIIIDNLPFWADFYREPRKEIALLNEWEAKMRKMVEETTNSNVVSLAGVPSWMLLLLRNILEYTGKKKIREVWPNLEVYFHGGVDFTPYLQQYNSIIGDEGINYVNIYNASEGFFGIQDQIDSDEMLLMLDYGVYYEFIPEGEMESNNPKTIQLQDVELGKNYAMVISTNSGLWRYKIGDTITFTSVFPYRIRITGRTKHFINACGEEIIVDNATNAFYIACRQTDAIIHEYTAAPLFCNQTNHTYHQWIVEFEKDPENPETFLHTFDAALKSVNSDYEAKRYQNMILKAPEIIYAPKGTFYAWLKQNNRLGGQYKIPRLSNNRKWVDEILTIIKDKG